MGIAYGAYYLVLGSALIILASLLLFTKLEILIDRANQSHTYKIVSPYKESLFKDYEDLFEEYHLRYKLVKRTKNGDTIIGTWHVHGSEKNHNRFTKQILHHSEVREFEF
jgi:putative Mg2+ transporter-C (MgtC) family protein